MVFVRLWNSNPFCTEIGLHGVVHREGCRHARNAPDGEGWRQSDSHESADRDFQEYTLFM